LWLAAAARQGQPVPNLFFGAVQFLLLRGEGPELARCYRTLGGAYRPEADPFPAFRAFCLAHRHKIAAIARTRLVQTSHTRRCALLLPAFELVSRAFGRRPLALIEVGASAGLTLLFDRYSYDYGDRVIAGSDPEAPTLHCGLRGPVPVPARVPEMEATLKISEPVFRHLVVRKPEKATAHKRASAAAPAPAEPVAAPAAAEPAATPAAVAEEEPPAAPAGANEEERDEQP